MRVTASAPGKLVLLGEYAVLQGATALVLAVDRRATVTLAPASGPDWHIISPTLGVQAHLRGSGAGADWTGAVAPELAWVQAVLQRFAGVVQMAPCHVELESGGFQLADAGGRHKLGLGSSAALTVALLGALHACAGQAPPTLAECIAAHRAIQHGRGSGIDIAASLQGGLLRFRLDGERASTARARLPDGLRWCCAYSGRPASTGAMLAAVDAWRLREPVSFQRFGEELASISARGADAMAANDAGAFIAAWAAYAKALARFGAAAGVDIASRGHRALAALAVASGCSYKSCGAGGGDVGVTLAVEDESLRKFRLRAAAAGFPMVDLNADPQGLMVAVTA